MYALTGLLAISLLAASWQAGGGPEPGAEREVLIIRVENEAITPVTLRYVRQAIGDAQDRRSQCVVLLIDTPGGLLESTREIVKEILRSEVPFIVYVAPTGARAASAGFFITLASHIAAMAPGTNIGAAHPVSIGGTPVPQSPPPGSETEEGAEAPRPEDEKIVNDTAAWARALAELRGRNAEWSERAVSESVSASAPEALDAGIVELQARDLSELIAMLDGRQVAVNGRTIRLDLKDVSVRELRMWWGDRFLSAIANPNVAFLLLILGFYGILFELMTPGFGVSGTAGAIALALAFFAFAILPINVIGLVLILIALALFVAEAFVVSYGILTAGGIGCLITGGLMLVDGPPGFPRVSPAILIPVALATAAIVAFLLRKVLQSRVTRVLTGSENMVQRRAVVDDDFLARAGRYEGLVAVHGELWRATSSAPLARGATVSVTGRDGLTLHVQPAAAESRSGEEPKTDVA